TSVSCRCSVCLFQAEDGIRDDLVTGVQTCALPILPSFYMSKLAYGPQVIDYMKKRGDTLHIDMPIPETLAIVARAVGKRVQDVEIGRASCRERVCVEVWWTV